MASAPAASVTIFGPSAGSGSVALQVLTTGKLRLSLYSAASANFARIDTSIVVTDGVEHDILFSWDTSQTASTTGGSCYVDGASVGTSGTWPSSATMVGYSVNKTSYQFGAPSGIGFECPSSEHLAQLAA